MRPRIALGLLHLFLFFVLAAAGCARQPGLFSEANARAHVGMLAGTIGSRPIGSDANARARAYIVDQLRLYGFDVRVQEADGRRPSVGQTARVSNVIAVRPGQRAEAIGLVSHYDSVPYGPGAADDALGVSVSLEAARVLAARSDRIWTLMVLVTDGEESGLMGAAALMTDRDVTNRLHAYVNLEAIGSSGLPMLFEAGPRNAWLAGAWAKAAPRPRGMSLATEIYRRLPNDTDFSVLARQDIPGLNLAATDDSYAYHTARDTPERLSADTVRATGEQVVALVGALDRVDITARTSAESTFFDIGQTAGVAYGSTVDWFLGLAAILFGVVAWVRATGAAVRREGVLRWLLTVIWALLGSTAVVASMVGATWALRLSREVYHPWYARPGRLFVLLLAVAVAVGWGAARLGRWLPERARVLRHPVVVWSVALPFWIALASAALWLAPGAAYLWLLPLLTAGLLLSLIPPANDVAVRAASVFVLMVSATLWLRVTVDLLRFVVALLGRLPIVTPPFVYGALIAVAGAMVMPPFIAIIAAARPLVRPALATALCLIAVAISAGYTYVAPAYTHDQPLRRYVRALQEGDAPSTWEVGSVEPGLDLDGAHGAPSGWTPVGSSSPPPGFSLPLPPVRHPFVYRGHGPALGPPPVTIGAFDVRPVAAGTELSVTVVPTRPGLAITFVLPEGVRPARASLPGVLRQGRWTARYLAPLPEGLIFTASFASPEAARIKDIRVLATVLGFGDGWPAPAWLPQERTVWMGDATWILSPAALPIAPVPPLR